jgi:fructan beta-fructosidase
MNDPNGMVYYAGEYHLFYQSFPDSTVWGPMHWGHAISKDLIHWKNMPIAIYPDSLGYIFSGSAVVDELNSLGMQKGKEKTLVAIFTYHNMAGEKAGTTHFQTQGIAYSTDKGRTWKKYAHNPVIPNKGDKDFRDPKLQWHAASGFWIVTLAVGNKVQFYRSRNLKDWTLSGTFGVDEGNHGGVWECPDLFEIKATSEHPAKWILLVSVGTGAPNGGSGTQYFMGNFDGQTFHNELPKNQSLWVDWGKDNYAGITWSHAPSKAPIFLGWMSNWQYAQQVPTKEWRSAMTLPRTLSLGKTKEGWRLLSNPVVASNLLRTADAPVNLMTKQAAMISINELDLNFDLSKSKNEITTIELFNQLDEKLVVGYNPVKNELFIDRTKAGNHSFSKEFTGVHIAPRVATDNSLRLHIFIDRSSIEVFADGGSVVMTDLFFPTAYFNLLKYSHQNLVSGKMYTLQSIWK